jgi:hypothetical protein
MSKANMFALLDSDNEDEAPAPKVAAKKPAAAVAPAAAKPAAAAAPAQAAKPKSKCSGCSTKRRLRGCNFSEAHFLG